ncbi:hypothetical protein, partial [Amycolatopsis rhizosphaerae]|uniref:hypothetical protein n=1 Tax=Amycolatopsis rhizosphaerae TaxID=2053003 RepID=UPI001C95DABC
PQPPAAVAQQPDQGRFSGTLPAPAPANTKTKTKKPAVNKASTPPANPSMSVPRPFRLPASDYTWAYQQYDQALADHQHHGGHHRH